MPSERYLTLAMMRDGIELLTPEDPLEQQRQAKLLSAIESRMASEPSSTSNQLMAVLDGMMIVPTVEEMERDRERLINHIYGITEPKVDVTTMEPEPGWASQRVGRRKYDRLPGPDGVYMGPCSSCDDVWNAKGNGPYHDASDRCESGGYSHCACDVCF